MRQINYSCILSMQFLRFKRNFNLVKIPIYINRKGECNNKTLCAICNHFCETENEAKMFISIQKKKREKNMRNWITNLSDLLLGNEKQELSWNGQKKSTIQRRSLSTSDKRTKTMKLLSGAQSTQKRIEGMKALSKFFSWSSRNSTFWQIWHLKSLNSCPNCRSYVSQHEVWNIWRDISALLWQQKKLTTIRLSEKSISLPITMPLNTHFWIPLSFTSLPLL